MMSFKMGALDNDEDLIRSAFRVLDKRGTGSVTEAEFRFLMTNIGDKISHDEFDMLIGEADKDGDGVLDYEEFVQLMTSKSTNG